MFVVVEQDNTDKAAIIKLMPSDTGDYYNVETAGYYRKNKWKDYEDVIADLREPGQSDAAADVSKPQIPNENGRESINAETQASSSEGKDTNNSANLQEKTGKTSDLGATSSPEEIEAERKKVNTNPTEGQKKAENYQQGHIRVDGYKITIENPKGSIRRGVTENPDGTKTPWENQMHNDYGKILGTEGTDGDHIDVFLSDNPTSGSVFIVDQVNPTTGKFDEHKCMYGFGSEEEARKAYLSNYSKGWKGMGNITEVSREDFKKWIQSSHRKTKPFADYALAKKKGIVDDHRADGEVLEPDSQEKALRDAVVDHLRSIGVEVSTDWQEGQRILDEYNGKGLYTNKKGDISRTSTPSEEARAIDTDNALSGAKVQQNSETANDSEEKIKEQRVYHGSGAEFDAFDHSHMGEGAGSQTFGYGTYVTNSKRIGTEYANITSRGWLYKGMDGKELRASNDDLPEGRYYTDNEIRSFVLDYMNAGSSFEQAVDKVRRDTQSAINDHEEHLSELSPSELKDLEGFRQELKLINSFKPEDFKRDDRYLYDVEIPNENEAYYIDYYGKMGEQKDVLDMVDNALTADGWKRQEIDSRIKFTKGDKQIILTPNQSGADLYAELEDALGSDRAASKFLNNVGVTGIKYPAGTIMGGGNGATNYVIFNESDAKITDRTKFFKTPDGHAYGYTYKGKIYLDPRIATSETSVHEYGHLWCEMIRQTAPEEWNHFKQVMLTDKTVQPIIDKVRRDYPELTKDGNEDDFIEEIITQFSGKRGSERLREIANEVAAERGGVFGKAEAVTAMQRLKNILNQFWEGVAKMMGWKYRNASQIADRMMADMLNGVDPREQMKEAANGRLRSQAEIERTLMGVHNISEDKLKKVLKQGGLANPSLAVIDTRNHMHTDYGEISLIPKSSLIDARTGRNAGTWTADAWTPTYPQVTKRMSSKGQDKYWAETRKSLGDDPGDIRSKTMMAFESWMENGVSPERLSYWYLKERGRNPEQVMYEPGMAKEDIEAYHQAMGKHNRFSELDEAGKKAVLALIAKDRGETPDEMAAKMRELKDRNTRRMNDGNEKAFIKMRAERVIGEIDEYGVPYSYISDYDYKVRNSEKTDGKLNVDATLNKAAGQVKSEGLEEDFNKWLEEKEKSYGVEEWLYNGTDSEGRQKWVRNTLENASRLMRNQGRNGAHGMATGNLIATVAKRVTTLDQIRKERGNLDTTLEEHEAFKEKWGDALLELCNKCGDELWVGEARLQEALGERNPVGYLKKEYGVELSREDAELLNTFIKEVRENFPTGYFETKFERPVGLDEFAVAVVPETSSPEVVKALKDAGLDVRTYDDTGTEEQRNANRTKATMDAVQGRDDIMFQRAGSLGPDSERPHYKNGENAMDYAERLVKYQKETRMEEEDVAIPSFDDADIAQSTYNQTVAKKSLKWQEAWQDGMISVKAILDAIEKETGNKATGAEDAYLFENRMHGRSKNMGEQFEWNYYKPMLEAFSQFMKATGMDIGQAMDYMIAKHGLERNMYYSFRDAMKSKVAEEIKKEREKLEKEYAKGRMSELDYNRELARLKEKEVTGVDDAINELRDTDEYKQLQKDYEEGKISYPEYIRGNEELRRNASMRKTPKKDSEGNIVSTNYYDDFAQDFSGLTGTLAKDMYDDAQKVKRAAQRTVDPETRKKLWQVYDRRMREAYQVARGEAERMVLGAEGDREPADKLWRAVNAATKRTLQISYESGMMDRKTYNKVRGMFDYYIPLRGWDENKASDAYTYVGKENVFSPAVKKTWGRTSQAENPLAYIGNIAVSTIIAGHRNMLKQHFLNYVMNNPTSLVSVSESWYENIGTENGEPVWVLRSADTAGKSVDEITQIVNDFNEEMLRKQAEGKAIPVTGRLRLDVNATKGQKAEHVIEVQRAGHTYQLYINGDPKAAQALNGTLPKSVSRISDTYIGRQLTGLNRNMAAFFTSKNPAFVISNLSRDLNMAGASVAIKESKEYNARFIANVTKVLAPRMGEGSGWVPAKKQPTGLMPSLVRKYMKGTLDPSNETERLFKEFMDEGGETGFVNMLSVDSFKDKMQKEITRMNGSSILGDKGAKEMTVGKGLRLLGETFEFYNRCAEDATRFIVYMTSRQMGKSLEDSIADAKDVTLNFNRKGTGDKGNAEIRDLFIFVNPAIQALSNMCQMAKGHKLKFGAVTAGFIAGGALMPIINQWLLNMFGDDDDKEAYWNLPPWVRKNNLVMWIPGTKNFLTIPLAQEFRVFYGMGEMISCSVMDHSVGNMGMELVSSVADLVPINPTGNGGNLLVDLMPTAIQPLVQIGENIDFTGKPIWKENQGNKYAPMYTKAYVSTPKWMVKLSEKVNDVTGGNEGKKGWVEQKVFQGDYLNNPAVWNHLLQGYFGGMYNTIAKGFDVFTTAAGGEIPKIYQTPVINRFLNRPVERDNAGVLGEEYYNLINERDQLNYELRVWKKKAADGEKDAQKHVDEIMQSDDYKRSQVVTHYEKIMKDMKAGEKAATTDSDKDLIKEGISNYRQQMTEELAAIDSGKDPLEAAMEKFNQAKTFAERNTLRMRIERLMGRTRDGKQKASEDEVKKALSYITDEESESRDVNDKYLKLATAEDIKNDALIKVAKSRIGEYTKEYKRLMDSNAFGKANEYRQKHQEWFRADDIIKQQSKAMKDNQKQLGYGHDAAVMKNIASNRNQMLKAIGRLKIDK